MTATVTFNDKPITVEFEYLGDGRPPFCPDEVNISDVYFQGVEITEFLGDERVQQIEKSVCLWLREEWLAAGGVAYERRMAS